jgi:hypothetical protein
MMENDGSISNGGTSRIRFGLLCPGMVLEQWQLRCLKDLLVLPYVELALVIILPAHRGRPKEVGPAVWRLCSRLVGRSYSGRLGDLRSLIAQVPGLAWVDARVVDSSPCLSAPDMARIQDLGLDFLLDMGGSEPLSELCRVARYGVWSFGHGDEEKYFAYPPCFWEIYHGDHITVASLRRYTGQPGGWAILKKGVFKTIDYSYRKNLDQTRFESARWPARVCADMHNHCAEYLNAPPQQSAAAVGLPPSGAQAVRFFLKLARNYLYNVFLVLCRHEDWHIGTCPGPVERVLEPGANQEIQWFPRPARGKFCADPFAVARGDSLYVLFEEFDQRSCKGAICGTRLGSRGCPGSSQIVFERPVHLSYPYLFEHDGDIFCIPEAAESREVVLYRAVELPHRWTRVATLLAGVAAVDSTVFRYQGRWWLTASLAEEDPNLKLFIWHAPDLLGPWKPHAGNPVKIDIRSARPAGTPFVHNGDLYRPAQDCSRTYGGRVLLQRVIRLTLTEFGEETAGVIEPSPRSRYPEGLHTVCPAGNLVMLDGKRFTFNQHGFRHALTKELSPLWAWLGRFKRRKGS